MTHLKQFENFYSPKKVSDIEYKNGDIVIVRVAYINLYDKYYRIISRRGETYRLESLLDKSNGDPNILGVLTPANISGIINLSSTRFRKATAEEIENIEIYIARNKYNV